MYQMIIIVGNLGRDPEMRYTPSGQAVTNFSLASSRNYLGKDGQRVQETTWFRITVWGKQAESCNNYLQKGRKVLVEGRLNPMKTAVLVSGPARMVPPAASFEVTANTVRFLDSRSGGSDMADAGGDIGGMMESEDEIPF